jgi:hypothetical protein
MRPASPADFPPALCSDYCLRCMRPFRDGERSGLVSGGRHAKYRDVGINVCVGCIQGQDLDRQRAFSVYRSSGLPLPLHDPERIRPVYHSQRPVPGFVKLSLLNNGLWRVSLHRGHAEISSAADIEAAGGRDAGMGYRYSADYGLYGPPEMITDAGAHTVLRVEFLDLRDIDRQRPASL